VEKIRDVRRGRAVSTQKLRLLVESRQSKLQPVFHQLFVTDEWRIDQQGHVAVLSGLALLLSLMAIYAVMAFTVVQRTREIGTRVALGADRWRVIAAIVRRPLLQIGLGIGTGGALVALMLASVFESTPTPFEASLIAAYALLMLGVCLSACLVPVRRALRLQPSQVLRADA
jgi:ABC-type antimicrobial peptide transport system permease subunit